MTLTEYINRHYDGSKTAFAEAHNIRIEYAFRWIKKGYVVKNGWLMIPHRPLKKGPKRAK